jgi:hypothetical protein
VLEPGRLEVELLSFAIASHRMRYARRVRASVVVLAACGRVAFDPIGGDGRGGPCVPIGHDEDADGVDDACDVCPHIADDQTDSDGDGVGDACDPSPLPKEHIELFDPFTSMLASWSYNGGEVFTGDAIWLPSTTVGASMREQLVEEPTIDAFTLIGAFGNVSGATHQFTMTLADQANHRIYCEAYQDTNMYVDIVDFDGTTLKTLDTAGVSSGLMGVPISVVYRYAPPNVTCDFTFGGTLHHLSAALPSGYAATSFSFFVNRLDLVASSFTQIRTVP